MTGRRYSDDEVRRILSLAAEAEQAAVAESERPWTLAEIERIGAEAGLAPQAVAAAALALEREPADGRRQARMLGLPLTVSRAVPLARGLTDDDWERLVAELRETFAAEGRVRVAAGRREWRVGNLRVTHEAAGSGALLRLRTRKGDALPLLVLGLAFTLLGAVALGLTLADTAAEPLHSRRVALASIIAALGVVPLVVGALRLPAWARQRARQFEALAEYARRIAAT